MLSAPEPASHCTDVSAVRSVGADVLNAFDLRFDRGALPELLELTLGIADVYETEFGGICGKAVALAWCSQYGRYCLR